MANKATLRVKLESLSQRGRFGALLSAVLLSPLFYVLLISGVVRAVYYSVLLTTTSTDTATYVNYHANILKGQVDGFRTPVYPYFIKLIGLFGQQNLFDHVVATQIILSFLSIIVFYRVVKTLFKVPRVIFAASLLYGVMLPVINFDKLVLTESLAVIFGLCFIYLVVCYLKRPSAAKAWLLTLYIFIAIMLRPSFIYLLPLIIGFWLVRLILNRKEWRLSLSGLAACVVVILLITGYSHLNKRSSDFNGISVVSNNNLIAEVTSAGIYPYGNDPQLSAAIDSNVHLLHDSAGQVSGAYLLGRFKPDRVHTFITNCFKNQPKMYLVYACGKLVDIEHLNMFTNYAGHRLGYLAFRLDNIEYYVFGVPFNLLFIFIELDIILIIISWTKRKQMPWLRLFLWLYITAQLMVAIFGGYSEYPRLILPVIPALLIALFGYIDKIFFAIDKRKLNEHPLG